jgi:hypothetical protein
MYVYILINTNNILVYQILVYITNNNGYQIYDYRIRVDLCIIGECMILRLILVDYALCNRELM